MMHLEMEVRMVVVVNNSGDDVMWELSPSPSFHPHQQVSSLLQVQLSQSQSRNVFHSLLHFLMNCVELN